MPGRIFHVMPTSRSDYVLREPSAADVAALAEVHWASWENAYRGVCDDAWLDSLTRQTFEAYHRPLLTAAALDPARPFVVATRGERVVGFARGGPTRATTPTGDPLPDGFADRWSAELYAIYVHPSEQGRGAGRTLFDHLVFALHERGHGSMCLWVLSGNTASRRFYEHRGGVLLPDVAPITLGNRRYDQSAYGWGDLATIG